MPKFEYRFHKLRSHLPDAPVNVSRAEADKPATNLMLDELNAMGKEGWEIVFVWPTATHVLMKRPLA